MGVIKHFKFFLDHSSVKGVPRIAKSDTCWLKVLWIVSASFFMIVCVTHLWKLVQDYLLYETVITINEERLNLIEGEGKRLTLLPSFSVCNLNPFASNLEKSSGLDFLNFYERTFDGILKYQNVTNYRDILMFYERNKNTPSSLFQFGSEEDIQSIAIQKENFILDCFLYIWMISEFILIPCEEKIEVIQIMVTAQMLNCFTLRLPKPSMESLNSSPQYFTGISITLYLDNIPPQHPYFKSYNPSNDNSAEGGKYISILKSKV